MAGSKKHPKKVTRTDAGKTDILPASLKNSRIEKYYNKIVAGFVIMTGLLLICIVYFSFAHTTIAITSKPVQQAITLTATMADLKGVIVVTDVEGSKQADSLKGTSSQAGKASGTVTLENHYSKDQPLVETTRLLSKEGVLFRTKKTVTVPTGGSVAVPVAADQEGVAGDIGPSTFEVVALWDGLKKDIYGTSSAAMTGGTTTIATVTADDIATVQKNLTEDLLNQAKTTLETATATASNLPENAYAINSPTIIATLQKDVDAKDGDVVDHLTATQKLTVGEVVVDKAVLTDFISSHLTAAVPAGITLDSNTSAVDSGDLDITVSNISSDRSSADLAINVTATGRLTKDAEVLQPKNFVKKSDGDIRSYLAGLDGVATVSIHFSPFWTHTAPASANNITVTVQ